MLSYSVVSYSRLKSSPSTWRCAPFLRLAANPPSFPNARPRARLRGSPWESFHDRVVATQNTDALLTVIFGRPAFLFAFTFGLVAACLVPR